MRRSIQNLIGLLLATLPIRHWPRILSRLTGVLCPRAGVRHDQVTSSGGANAKILFDILDQTANLDGDVAECGVWRGRTLIAMGIYLRQSRSQKTIWGFDSFEGFHDGLAHTFRDGSMEVVNEKTAIFRLTNVRVVRGYFPESFRAAAQLKFSFVHVDCDLYESYRDCLEFFFPRMVRNGVILFDEYGDPEWPGANRAVDEFCRQAKVSLQSIVKDNTRKFFMTAPCDTGEAVL